MKVQNTDGINDLRAATIELVNAQKKQIIDGVVTAKDIAHSKLIIEGEVESI